MTINKFFAKLRKRNAGQYRMLGFCIFLSVLLISSFALMYLGPTVQDFLPEGGDTRKMASLLMAVTAVGCAIFTLYASNLFFRYKSREYGIFLALGETKSVLKKALFKDLAVLTAIASLLGLILAIPVSYINWKLFEIFLISTDEMTYRFGITGFYVGAIFALILALLLGIAGQRFVKRSDIMKILKTQHQPEMVKEVKSWTFPVGIILIILGILLGLGLPGIGAYIFHKDLPAIISLFYLLSLVGIYLVLLSIVSQNRLGKKKKKFYKNMVSISLMRFSAKTATKNMCVIVLLLFTCLFAAFYGFTYTDDRGLDELENRKAYTMHYPAAESQITRADIYNTAEKHGVTIRDFGESDAANLVISYKHTDFNEDTSEYVTAHSDKAKLALFFSASSYEVLTGRSATVSPGSYKTVTTTDYKENIWNFIDGLYEIANPDTGKTLALVNEGTLEFDSLTSMSDPYTYVLNDEDYATMTAGISETWVEHVVSFQVSDLYASIDYAKDLLAQYVSHASSLSNHYGSYDLWEERLAHAAGEEYSYSGTIDMSIDNSMLLGEWKYRPNFVILTILNSMPLICVYVMLCLYIFIIAMTAIAIMTYVRSITIATDNKDLFQNLQKLGANSAYQRNILKKQLAKLFQYPGILGCLLSFFFSACMYGFNDGRYTDNEIHILTVMLGINLLVLLFLYGVYRFSKKSAEKILEFTF